MTHNIIQEKHLDIWHSVHLIARGSKKPAPNQVLNSPADPRGGCNRRFVGALYSLFLGNVPPGINAIIKQFRWRWRTGWMIGHLYRTVIIGKCIALSAANLLAPSADFLLALIASMWKTSLRLRECMQRLSKCVDFYMMASCTRINHALNHDMFFTGQVQYLVMLEDDTCCSPHCKWRFICDQDRGKHSKYLVMLEDDTCCCSHDVSFVTRIVARTVWCEVGRKKRCFWKVFWEFFTGELRRSFSFFHTKRFTAPKPKGLSPSPTPKPQVPMSQPPKPIGHP